MKYYYKSAITSSFRKMVHNQSKNTFVAGMLRNSQICGSCGVNKYISYS